MRLIESLCQSLAGTCPRLMPRQRNPHRGAAATRNVKRTRRDARVHALPPVRRARAPPHGGARSPRVPLKPLKVPVKIPPSTHVGHPGGLLVARLGGPRRYRVRAVTSHLERRGRGESSSHPPGGSCQDVRRNKRNAFRAVGSERATVRTVTSALTGTPTDPRPILNH